MPPKAKYSKQEILEKAIEIIVFQGYEKLTARELAAILGTSVKPIFTAFENMEEVKRECISFAFDRYHSYFAEGLTDEPFKQIGRVYIRFAIEDSNLFKLLFLQSQEQAISFSDYMKNLDDNYGDSINMIKTEYNLTADKAEALYKQMWIYCTGIATLCATKQCYFDNKEIENLLDIACNGFINEINK